MKGLVCGFIGLVIGAAGGYFVARFQYKKKLQEEIQKIEETQKELYSKKVHEAGLDKDEDEDEELYGHPDIYTLAEEEIKNGEAEPTDIRYAEDEEDEDDWIDEEDQRRMEFEKKFEPYVGTSIPYPITQDQYEDDKFNSKMKLIYYPEEDKAYDDFDNQEYETFHTEIGDEEYNTLSDENCFDCPGVWYIRNDSEGIDYMVEIGNRLFEDKGHVGLMK